jgi:hypothetical protein
MDFNQKIGKYTWWGGWESLTKQAKNCPHVTPNFTP